MSGGVPRPIAVLACVLVASVALGAWLNDSGPWAPPPPFDPHVSTFAYVPSTAQAVPVVVPGDKGSLTNAMRIVANSMLGQDESEDTEADPAGFCDYTTDAKTRTITFAWAGAIPPAVLAKQTQARGKLGIRIATRPVAFSADELDAAAAELEDHGDRALREAAVAGELAHGLHTASVLQVRPHRCAGLRVEVSGPRDRKPTSPQLHAAAPVLRGLVPGIQVAFVPVAIPNCDDASCLAGTDHSVLATVPKGRGAGTDG